MGMIKKVDILRRKNTSNLFEHFNLVARRVSSVRQLTFAKAKGQQIGAVIFIFLCFFDENDNIKMAGRGSCNEELEDLWRQLERIERDLFFFGR